MIRHATIRNPSILDSPSISSISSSVSAKYVVQTTSFPDSTTNDRKISSTDFRRKYKDFTNQQRSSILSPIVVQKQINQREESPLPIVENPIFQPPPPQKPPRTFEQEHRYDQKVPSSSSSSSHSPIFDLGKFLTV